MAQIPVNGKIVNFISRLPANSSVLEFSTALGNFLREQGINLDDSQTFSPNYLGFFTDLYNAVNSGTFRGQTGVLRNPDFNLLSANGLDPVTPLEGSDFEFVKMWYVVTGGGSNDYVLKANPYSQVGYSPSGSNYFMSIVVIDLDEPLYFYNLNYSLTNQFDSVGKYSGKDITFSAILKNNVENGDEAPSISFSAFINGADEFRTAGIILQNGYNEIAESIQLPDLFGTEYDADPYIQFRLNIDGIGTNGLDIALAYIKAEISDSATQLEVDHTLEKIICDALV
jgi:hypothetical protein